MSTIRQLTCSDGHVVYYRVWLPEQTSIEAVVQILHGMAEHSQRYHRFAEFLNSKGIAVYAQDHRGHGETASNSGEPLGWFAEQNGWQRVSQDVFELSNVILSDFPKKSLFLFGHSMGSFLARTVMSQHPDLYDGVILMGSGPSQGLLGKVGKLLARSHVNRYGSKHPDAMLDKMSFGSYNKRIKNPQTTFDWLSRDKEEVAKYIEDPLCGYVCTSKFYDDLLEGIETANNRVLARKLPSDLPVLVISGAMDPVGNFGKGVKKVYDMYRESSLADVTLHMVPEARHELLQETNRAAIREYLYSWISKRM